jgi:hypothetical protein
MNDVFLKLSNARKDLQSVVQKKLGEGVFVLQYVHLTFVLGGGALAGAAQFMAAPVAGATPWPKILGFLGVGCVLLGSVVLTFLQRNGAEELRAAQALSDATAELEATRRADLVKFSQEVETVKALDIQRRHLAAATSAALEVVDQAIFAKSNNLAIDVDKILTSCLQSLVVSLGLDSEDDFCISIFKRDTVNDIEKMVRFADRRPKPVPAGGPAARSWKKGEGLTGYAWQTGRPLFVPDTASNDIRHLIQGITDDDTFKYKSASVVLIEPGPTNGQPWGAITVTTNRAGCFDNEGGSFASIHADAVRTMARILAILVAALYI